MAHKNKIIDYIYREIFKNRTDENDFLKKTEEFFLKKSQAVKIYKETVIGRSFQFESYILETNNIKYTFPIIDDLDSYLSKSIYYKIAQKGKFFPRGMPNYLKFEMFNSVERGDEEAYMEFLKDAYTEDAIISIFVDSMCFTKNYEDYLKVIEGSIKNFFMKDYSAAISLLLPCIEGINRKILSSDKKKYYRNGDFREIGIKESIKKWITLIYTNEDRNYPSDLLKENKIYYYLDEVVIMIDSYFKYLNNFLYMNSTEFKKKYPKETLNRHEILHGYSTDYGTKENWYKLFCILDFLLFVDEEYNLVRPQKSITFFKKFNQFKMLSKKAEILSKLDVLFDSNYSNYFLEEIEKSVMKAIEEVEKIPLFSTAMEFKHLLADKLEDNLQIHPIGYLNYHINKYPVKNMVQVKFGSKNIFEKKTSRDLLIILIDGEELTDEEKQNIYFLIKVSNSEKKIVESQIINSI